MVALLAAGCAATMSTGGGSEPQTQVPLRCATPESLGWGDERRGLIRADVDGDGRRDTVAVLAGYSRPPSCRFFVAVDRGRGGLLTAALSDPIVGATPAALREHAEPRLSAVAEIDGRSGAEFLVTLQQSASGGGVGVFAVHGEQLLRLRVAGAPPGHLFWSNSHNFNVSATDCSGRFVVSTGAERDPRTGVWTARRTFLRVDGPRFRTVGTEVRRLRDLGRLPEFRPDNLWFRDCPEFRRARLRRE